MQSDDNEINSPFHFRLRFIQQAAVLKKMADKIPRSNKSDTKKALANMSDTSYSLGQEITYSLSAVS